MFAGCLSVLYVRTLKVHVCARMMCILQINTFFSCIFCAFFSYLNLKKVPLEL